MNILQQDDQIASRWIVTVFVGVVVVFGAAVLWVFLRIPSDLGVRAAAPVVDRADPQVINGVDWGLFADRAPGLQLKAEQRHYLNSYGWVDRRRGIVHIPIEQAINLYVSGQVSPPPIHEVSQ